MADEHPLFRTTRVLIEPNTPGISRSDSMIWVGSCFVESMEPWVRQLNLNACFNPLGVCFHPEVMARLLSMPAEGIEEKSFEHRGIWKNYWLAARFCGSEEGLQQQIREAVFQRDEALLQADWLVMTWGTAFLYHHHQLGEVGKCHKMPANLFEKKRSTIQDITNTFETLVGQLRKNNPKLKIILTVSPVRHSRDGLTQNAISKSILRLAAQQLVESIPNAFYFPAYEMVLDELRDYRFFGPDLVHPNEEAVSYIWRAFEKQFFSPEQLQTNKLMMRVKQLENHQPLGDRGEEFDQWQQMLKNFNQELTKRLELGF